MVKNWPASAGDTGSIPGLGRSPGEENGNPLQYSCLEDPSGQRSLRAYSPWGLKESYTTEHSQHTGHLLSLLQGFNCVLLLLPTSNTP